MAVGRTAEQLFEPADAAFLASLDDLMIPSAKS
jgi:hypothetical protein